MITGYYDLKEVQNKILNIFKSIDEICRKYNLSYYAIGGTCLGAVRHSGFIPWDDDLDIAMPRKDYEIFKQIANSELPSGLELVTGENIPHYECLFMKVQDINTTYVPKNCVQYPDRYLGIYVDIMPLDGLPEEKREIRKHTSKLKRIGLLNTNRRRYPKELHKGWKLFIWRIIYTILLMLKPDYFSTMYDNELKKYDFYKSKYTFYGWSKRCDKLVFSIEVFSDYEYLKFEDCEIRCPIGYKDFLETIFGDYMSLPPEKERVPKHDSYLDLSNSYTWYQKNGINLKEKEKIVIK